MTRGKLIIITNDGAYITTEFNGDMYPTGNGEKAIEILSKIHCDNINDFAGYVDEFDNEHYGYKKELDEELTKFRPGKMELDFSENYIRKFSSDYLYIKNLKNEKIEIIDGNGKIVKMMPRAIMAFYFGNREDITEQLEKIIRAEFSSIIPRINHIVNFYVNNIKCEECPCYNIGCRQMSLKNCSENIENWLINGENIR